MSLLAQAKITEDAYIIMRIKAQAARAGVPQPHEWTMRNIWALAASEGWADAYAPSLTIEATADPAAWAGAAGADPTVITDVMISDAVQDLLFAEASAAAYTQSAAVPAEEAAAAPASQ